MWFDSVAWLDQTDVQRLQRVLALFVFFHWSLYFEAVVIALVSALDQEPEQEQELEQERESEFDQALLVQMYEAAVWFQVSMILA